MSGNGSVRDTATGTPVNGEVIVYFRDVRGGSSAELGSRDFGHVFVEVVDHGSGRSDFYDFWSGHAGEGILNTELTDLRREVHWQARLPVSAESAERMLREIESHRLQSTQYHPSAISEIFAQKNTCVTGTTTILESGGIHIGKHL